MEIFIPGNKAINRWEPGYAGVSFVLKAVFSMHSGTVCGRHSARDR